MNNDILEQLYEGELFPSEQLGHIAEEKGMMELCDQLCHRIGDEERAMLDSFTDQLAELNGAYSLRGFCCGFRLGARIALALFA